MKILLTGATGFIGSQTARALLADGHEVHALVRPTSDLWRIADIQSSLHLIPGNLLDRELNLPTTFDVCVHCAWTVDPVNYLETELNHDHLQASLRLARTLAQSGCQRLVITGTCFEYDLASRRQPISETSHTRPQSQYAKAKLILFDTLRAESLPLSWARLFYQYGPMEHPKRLVPVVIGKLLRNDYCQLPTGDLVRDFLHVSDVGGALAAIVRSDVTGIVNIGSSQPVTVRQVAETIGEILGRSNLLEFGAAPNRPGDPPYVVANTVKLRSTGWEPKFTLSQGLLETIEWWKQQSPAGR